MGCKGTKFFSHSGIQPPKSFEGKIFRKIHGNFGNNS